MSAAELEAVVRAQITRCVANAIQSGVPSTGIMNRATEEIMRAARAWARPGRPPVHLLTIDLTCACGADGPQGGSASSALAEVNCEACKLTPLWARRLTREVA